MSSVTSVSGERAKRVMDQLTEFVQHAGHITASLLSHITSCKKIRVIFFVCTHIFNQEKLTDAQTLLSQLPLQR